MKLNTKRRQRRFRGRALEFHRFIKHSLCEDVLMSYMSFRMNRRFYHIAKADLLNLDTDWRVALYKAFVYGRHIKTLHRGMATIDDDEIIHGVLKTFGAVTGRMKTA